MNSTLGSVVPLAMFWEYTYRATFLCKKIEFHLILSKMVEFHLNVYNSYNQLVGMNCRIFINGFSASKGICCMLLINRDTFCLDLTLENANEYQNC